jgi:hypothetical protein
MVGSPLSEIKSNITFRNMVGSLLSEIKSNITFSFLFDVRTILLCQLISLIK